MSYENVRFCDLTVKRLAVVRETVAKMWLEGRTSTEIAKKVRVSRGSISTAIGNFERLVQKPKKHLE